MITEDDRQIQRGMTIAALNWNFFEAEAVAGEGSPEEKLEDGDCMSFTSDMESSRIESFSSWDGIDAV